MSAEKIENIFINNDFIANYIRQKFELHSAKDIISSASCDEYITEIAHLYHIAKKIYDKFSNSSYVLSIIDMHHSSCEAYKKDEENKILRGKTAKSIKEEQLQEAFIKRTIEEIEKQRIEQLTKHKYNFSECHCFLCRQQNVHPFEKIHGLNFFNAY